MLRHIIVVSKIQIVATQIQSIRHRSEDGFSLIEVVVSLAIVAFTCVTLIGMIPMGLVSFHQAVGTTVESQIVQSLSNDILLANFSNLYQYNGQTYFYDNEGSPLPSSTRAVFTTTVSILGVGNDNSPVALTNNGVSTGSTQANTSAYAVKITIANIHSPNQSHAYSVIIANNNL